MCQSNVLLYLTYIVKPRCWTSGSPSCLHDIPLPLDPLKWVSHQLRSLYPYITTPLPLPTCDCDTFRLPTLHTPTHWQTLHFFAHRYVTLLASSLTPWCLHCFFPHRVPHSLLLLFITLRTSPILCHSLYFHSHPLTLSNTLPWELSHTTGTWLLTFLCDSHVPLIMYDTPRLAYH
jgi:hypothetical protein